MAFSHVPSTQRERRGCEEEAGPRSEAGQRDQEPGSGLVWSPQGAASHGVTGLGLGWKRERPAGCSGFPGATARGLVREGDRTVPAWQPRHKCPCLARCREEGGPLAVGDVTGHVPKVRPEAWAHGTTCSASLDGGGRSCTQMLYRCLEISLSPGGWGGGRSTCLIPENVQPQSLSRDASGAGCATASFPLDRGSGRGSGRGQKAN